MAYKIQRVDCLLQTLIITESAARGDITFFGKDYSREAEIKCGGDEVNGLRL